MEEGIDSIIDAGMGFMRACRQAMDAGRADSGMYSPLALAYLGDGVYELMIRTRVVSHGNMPVNKMNRKTASLVKAPAQAAMIRLLEPELTDEEHAVFKRGRNAKSATTAKNATVIDYRMATGFEALVGYLYLEGRFERLEELVSHGLEKMGERRYER